MPGGGGYVGLSGIRICGEPQNLLENFQRSFAVCCELVFGRIRRDGRHQDSYIVLA